MSKWAFAIIAGVLMLAGWSVRSGEAQAPPAPETPKVKQEIRGVGACSFCHTTRLPTHGAIVCKCNEVVTWETFDKHADAWKVLLSPRAQQMGKLLGYEDVELTTYKKVKDGGETKVVKDETKRANAVAVRRECVVCHGVAVTDPRYRQDENAFREETLFMKEEGINCYACHGRADNAQWVYQHFPADKGNNAAWRAIKGKDGLTSREIKDRDFGMRDLWDPAKRAQLCLSCHVGDAREGKFVTHAMYAAGHPPLPSIEVATFSEEMPRHWDYPLEKPERARQLQEFDPVQEKFAHARLVLLGGVAAMRAAVDLLAVKAEQTAALPDGDARVLDLALFDCYACHHELKERNWRAERGYRGKPGRPQPQLWPTVLVRAGLIALGRPETEIDAVLKPLHEVFNQRPFGDPAAVAAQGAKVLAWLDKLSVQLNAAKFDAERVQRVLTFLGEVKPNAPLDYDAVRLRAWAFSMIYAESRGLSYAEIKKARAPLDDLIKLTLPATRKQSLEQDLPRALLKRNEFDPDVFTKEYRRLVQKLMAPE